MLEIWVASFFDYLSKNLLAGIAATAAVLGVAVVIIVALLQSRSRKRRIVKKHFRIIWKKSSSLKPKDLLESRPFHKAYHKRNEDDKILEAVSAGKNVLIVGQPLSGKTRAVYEVLTEVNKACDVLMARATDIDVENFLFPKHLKFWRPKILVIDDLHRFVELQNFHHLLTAAHENDMAIIATCRSGFECDKAKAKIAERGLDFDTLFHGSVFELGKVSQDEAQKVAEEAEVDWAKLRFDGTIGSIFMRLSEMESRFKQCTHQEKTILRVLRRLYFCGVYEENQIFPLEWVRAVAQRGEFVGTGPQWIDWIETLEGKEFLIRQKGAVKAEEVYLQDIIKPEAEVSELELLLPMLTALTGLPDALFKLGTRACGVGEIGTRKAACMKVAVCAYRLALEVYTIDDFSLQHAIIQYNLGTVYGKLAEIDDKRRNSKSAVGAYERALRVYTIERFPKDYAESQSNLGVAYRALAEVEEPAVNAKKAIRACKEALKARSRDHFLTDRSGPYNNLANAYIILAGVENPAANAKKAIQVCQEALNVRNGNNVPRNYAKTQNNLGNAYQTLALVQEQRGNCNRAIAAYLEALKDSSLERCSMEYAFIQNNLGCAYQLLAGIRDTAHNCKRAIRAYNAALVVCRIEVFPQCYAMTQNNLGGAYQALAKVEDKAVNAIKAIRACEEALRIRTRLLLPLEYATTQNNLALAYRALAEVKDKAVNAKKAIEACREALAVRSLDRSPIDYARSQNNLGSAYRTLAEVESKAKNCKLALAAYQEALGIYTEEDFPQIHQLVLGNVARLVRFCGDALTETG